MKKKLAILLIVAMIVNTSGTITLADAFNNVAPTETKETDKFFDGLAEEESLSMDTGWIFQNGNIYYLQTEINTTYGKMFTGVQTIDGIKYEFGKNGVLKGLAN